MINLATTPALRDRFISGMAQAACTVSVVTTDGPAGRHGVTVSAMSSVAADGDKPTLLVCIHHCSPAARAIIDNGVFCVNVLRDDQSYVSECFAGRHKTVDGDKFACATWTTQRTGAPRIVDPLVAFDCRLRSSNQIATHHVFIGQVEELFVDQPGSPLIYANRAYGTTSRHRPRMESSGPAEMLRLGAFHTFGPYLVPELLERLAVQGHSVDLELLEGDQRQIVDALQAGAVDAALLYDFDLGKEIETTRLAGLQPYVLLAEGHPLCSKKRLSLVELANEPLILLDAPPSGHYFLSLFSDQSLNPLVRIRSSSFEMVRGLVARGFGYSLLTTKPAGAMSYDGRALATRPLKDATRPSTIVLASLAQRRASPAAAAFSSVCRDLFKAGALPKARSSQGLFA